MKKVYIAGPYSADTIIGGLENIRRGTRMAAKLLQHGMAVFCPWLDHQIFLQLREGEKITLERIQQHSVAWLKASDAVLVMKGHELSKGTQAELAVACAENIPVFFSYLDLCAWNMAEAEIEKVAQ